jgi:signal transduction histidine kinase
MAASSEDLLDLVATGLAHEVRNPLNAVQLNLRILAEQLLALPPAPAQEAFSVLERIAGEVGQIDRFVRDFLRFARPLRLSREPLHVQGTVGELGSLLRIDVTGRTNALVDADGVQLRQAIIHVAQNAIDVTPRGGAIALVLGDAGAWVTIDVFDAGPPLAPDVAARAFEPFATWRDGASGLGLPNARRIIEAHGGTLALEAVPAGGNCARIRLPALRRG